MFNKDVLKLYYHVVRNVRKISGLHKKRDIQMNFAAAELIRNTHSIEKGLSIKNPRIGFGKQKQREMMGQISILQNSNLLYHREVCEMAIDAITEYIEYHRSKSVTDEFICELQEFIDSIKADDKFPDKIGGTQSFFKKDAQFNIREIENFIYTRHSIRDFDSSPVDENKLLQALILAQRAPSACNRQSVRAYVINPEDFAGLSEQLQSIGGFAEAVSRYVLITGKHSSYRLSENNQYIVSASMYAAYLTLTLHLYGMGGCVIQRPVVWTPQWAENRKKLKIPVDEQIICMVAVGNLKESCRVPVSHRLQNCNVIKFI